MSGTEEDTENISAPRDKSLDQHWEPWTLGPRTPFANVRKGRNVRNVGIRENGSFGIFEGSRTVEKQKHGPKSEISNGIVDFA